MTIAPPYYPIVYVRGFAASRSEIEETVATPYMGFNLGATKVRQDYQGRPVRFIFESPLIRLMKDEGYIDCYDGGDFIRAGNPAPAKSVWIFRYYDKSSEAFSDGNRLLIPQFSEDLREFILRIRQNVCGADPAAQKRFKVYLVAHSMGGLICRCYLQNTCLKGVVRETAKEARARNRELDLPGEPMVDKVFTYATPHNGIEMLGLNVPDLGGLDPYHARNFNRDYMREYLRLPKNAERADSLNGAFPRDRFFCLIGTNYKDYSAFMGMSRKGAGSMSDGLVMMRNASVDGAPRAFVHRSHSGDYGIVNSEEGYQNLRRFLFGDFRADVQLLVDEITLPKEIQAFLDEGKQIRASYYIDVTATVRGATYVLNERKCDHESALLRQYDDIVTREKPVYLFSGYLSRKAKTTAADDALAFQVRIAIRVPIYEVERKFWLNSHFEGGYLFEETVTLKLRPDATDNNVLYSLVGSTNDKPAMRSDEVNAVRYEVPMGFAPGRRDPPRPGFSGKLVLLVSPWNVPNPGNE